MLVADGYVPGPWDITVSQAQFLCRSVVYNSDTCWKMGLERYT